MLVHVSSLPLGVVTIVSSDSFRASISAQMSFLAGLGVEIAGALNGAKKSASNASLKKVSSKVGLAKMLPCGSR